MNISLTTGAISIVVQKTKIDHVFHRLGHIVSWGLVVCGLLVMSATDPSTNGAVMIGMQIMVGLGLGHEFATAHVSILHGAPVASHAKVQVFLVYLRVFSQASRYF